MFLYLYCKSAIYEQLTITKNSIMVRIGVYTGVTKQNGLSISNFKVLNELEETRVPLTNFKLINRYNNFKERFMLGRIYFVNITENPVKPVSKFEILDKCKFIKYENGRYIISYKRYGGEDLIDLYENRKPTLTKYVNWCLKRGKQSKRIKFNTFTKFILNKLFSNYGYNDVIKYDNKNEFKKWYEDITHRVKYFNNRLEDSKTNWCEKEEEFLINNMNTLSEKEIANELGRTVPSVATKKWKIKHNYKLKTVIMKSKIEEVSKKLKDFRAKHGLSQVDLSRESGISLSIVNQLECKKYLSTTTSKVKELMKYVDGYDNTETKEVEPERKMEVTEPVSNNEFVDNIVNVLSSINEQLTHLNSNFDTMFDKDKEVKARNGLATMLNEISKMSKVSEMSHS